MDTSDVILTSWVLYIKIIKERVARCNRTLVDKSRTISPVGTLLKEAVPVLERKVSIRQIKMLAQYTTYDGGGLQHVRIL